MSRSKFFRGIALAAIAAIALAACGPTKTTPTTQSSEQAVAAANQTALIASTPTPKVTNSLERQNLVERAKRVNDSNLVSCITLFTAYGQVVAFYSVDGKVSSLNSYLQSGDQVIRDPNASNYSEYYTGSLVVEAPDIDGAYGSNANGIFFYTADTFDMVEWNGLYHWSEQCAKPTAEPLFITQAYLDAPSVPAPTTQLPSVTVTAPTK